MTVSWSARARDDRAEEEGLRGHREGEHEHHAEEHAAVDGREEEEARDAAGHVGDRADVREIEQLRQQELTLYREILTLSDEQVEALAPDAREQVCPIGLVDDVGAATTTDHAIVAMAAF